MSIRGTLCALTGGTYMADKNFLTDIIDADLAEGKVQQIHTRFPPEPNGYLHIGSAKAIYINWSIANQYGGKFNLRLDDTNPAREGEEYVNSIIEDLHWLGADPNGGIFYGSDFFDKCYEYAEKLITEGKAYVDDLTREEMREYRGSDAGKPSRPSPWRDRSPEENLDLFRRMRAGEFKEGEKTLRAKIDLASPNMNMRDPAIYRIKYAEHHRQGNKWCIYPMYTFAHPIEDSLENITHSICTLEFDDQRAFYDWALERIVPVLRTPQYEEAKRIIADMAEGKDDRALAFARAAYNAAEKLGQSEPEAAMREIFGRWAATGGPETLEGTEGKSFFTLLQMHT